MFVPRIASSDSRSVPGQRVMARKGHLECFDRDVPRSEPRRRRRARSGHQSLPNDNGGTAVCSDYAFQVNGGSDVAFESDCRTSSPSTSAAHTVTETESPDYTATYEGCVAVSSLAGAAGPARLRTTTTLPRSRWSTRSSMTTAAARSHRLDAHRLRPERFLGHHSRSSPAGFDAGTYDLSASLWPVTPATHGAAPATPGRRGHRHHRSGRGRQLHHHP